MRLLVYVPEAGLRQRVLRAAAGWAVVAELRVNDPARAAATFRSVGCVAAIVATLDEVGRPTTGIVRHLHGLWPGLPIILVLEGRPDPPSLRALVVSVRAGASALVADPPDPAALRAEVQAHAVAVGWRRGTRDMLPTAPAAVRPLLAWCLAEPARAHRVEAVAAGLGVHRRTLVN